MRKKIIFYNAIIVFKKIGIFWKKNPAVWVSLSLFCSIMLLENMWALVPLMILILSLPRKEKIYSLLICVIACLFIKTFYLFPTKTTEGIGEFSITSFNASKFGGYNYKGKLHSFKAEDKYVAKNITFKLSSEKRYNPNFRYSIAGELIKKPFPPNNYVIKSKNDWIPLKKEISLVKFRYHAKKKISQFLTKNLKEKEVSHFLASLITGITFDEVQRYVFSNLGLAHLFAISGFHFALFAYAFHFFLRLIFPRKVEAIILLLLLTLFFLFIGESPSVERAWFIAFFSIFALLFEKEKRSLNTFGLSLLFVLIFNPLFALDLSLQLSFLATGGILLFFSTFDYLLQIYFPKEPLYLLKKKSLLKQYLYIFTTFFRKAIALNLAVHLTLFPLLIATFHRFAWHSIIYNLFYPFLVSIALILLIVSLMFHFVPLLSTALYFLTTFYTKMILKIVDFPPFPMRTWYIEQTSPWFVPIVLTCICSLGIIIQIILEEKKRPVELTFF